ncbi:hypothetical protein AAFX19_08460 [Vibrio harveyi]
MLIDKNKDIRNFNCTEVDLLCENESFIFATRQQQSDLTETFKRIGYNFLNLEPTSDYVQIHKYLGGLHKIIYSLGEKSTEKKYKSVVNFFSHICLQLLGNSNYNYAIGLLQSIAYDVESKRYDNYKPILSGRIFIDINFARNKENIDIDLIYNHLTQMIALCAEDSNGDHAVELYRALCQSLHYTHGELSFYFHSNVSLNLYQTDLSDKLDVLIGEGEVTKESVANLVNQYLSDEPRKEELISEFLEELWREKYNTKMMKSVSPFLYSLSDKPERLLEIKNCFNAIGSEVHNITTQILPESIDGIIERYLETDKYDYHIRNDDFNLKVTNSLMVLLIYKISKHVYEGTQRPNFSVENKSYKDVETLLKALKKLESIAMFNLSRYEIKEFILKNSIDVYKVESNVKELFYIIRKELVLRKRELLRNGLLDESVINRYKASFSDGYKKLVENNCLFKRLKVSPTNGSTYTSNYVRLSFMGNTGIYHDFTRIGGMYFQHHLDRILFTFLSKKGHYFEDELPYTERGTVIISSKIRAKLADFGYKFSGEELTWRDGRKLRCIMVHCALENYYIVSEGQSLFKIRPNQPLYELDIVDKGKRIQAKVTFNFSPNID